MKERSGTPQFQVFIMLCVSCLAVPHRSENRLPDRVIAHCKASRKGHTCQYRSWQTSMGTQQRTQLHKNAYLASKKCLSILNTYWSSVNVYKKASNWKCEQMTHLICSAYVHQFLATDPPLLGRWGCEYPGLLWGGSAVSCSHDVFLAFHNDQL